MLPQDSSKQAESIVEQTRSIYAITQWGGGYFDINSQGNVCVKPRRDSNYTVDLYELAASLKSRHLSFPVLIRFIDILKDRIDALQQAFDKARRDHRFNGKYMPIYPIKVNQQRKVIEGILAADNIGLEAGSKAELLAILGLSGKGMVICNGYKDQAYIRLALIGVKMGLNLYIVIEKPSELDIVIAQARQLKVEPQLGVRVRLSSIGSGKWQNSGGEKSKFGLHAGEIIKLVKKLEEAGWLNALQLMHFHMGSQIANIHDIKTGLQEAARLYAELRLLGAGIRVVDAGGGLGIDYDGTQSRSECSINYSLEEYAQNIIASFAAFCDEFHLPHPDIVTESGRAITAHHALLVTNVIDVETVNELRGAEPLKPNIVESYHDAQFDLQEARAMFLQNKLDLSGLAEAESHYISVCRQIKLKLDPNTQTHQRVLQELREKLADKIFCNFSLFQSMPDVWGINQVFPIMPIHRLNELPDRHAVIQDLTCDSDGRIDCYVNRRNTEKTLAVHQLSARSPYLIGFFLLGAYQEILGDMHNLFGDTDSINIEMDENGYHFAEPIKGEHVSDLLDYVHIDPSELKLAYRRKLAQTDLDMQQQRQLERELVDGLTAYTYLEK